MTQQPLISWLVTAAVRDNGLEAFDQYKVTKAIWVAVK